MAAQGLNRAARPLRTPRAISRVMPQAMPSPGPWVALLAALCFAAGAAQAQQSSAPPDNSQQSAPQAHAGQEAGPMVLGEGPDAGQDSDSAPPPAGSSSQSAHAPRPITLVPWPSPAGATAVAGKPETPIQPPAPVVALVPVPAPANAGGDAARQQINNECVDLLKMADDLKSAVDKTNQNVLSVQVVRKANEIEQLAKRVKDEIRPVVARN